MGEYIQKGRDDQAVKSESDMTIRLDKMGAMKLAEEIIQAPEVHSWAYLTWSWKWTCLCMAWLSA